MEHDFKSGLIQDTDCVEESAQSLKPHCCRLACSRQHLAMGSLMLLSALVGALAVGGTWYGLLSNEPPVPNLGVNASGCANRPDASILISLDSTFYDNLVTCGKKCFADSSCVVPCIARSTNISNSCALCWGSNAACGKAHCLPQCLVSKPKCRACITLNCQKSLLQCTQLPLGLLPSF